MSKFAIREDLLPGATVDQRLAAARELGFSAVEFPVDDLDDRIDEIDDALRAHGIAASGVNMGAVNGWVSADIARRNKATNMLRQALACALDLEAEYVTFAPQIGASDMPDLTPFASPMELQKELLIWLLRGFSDLADAMDAKLALQPRNRAETAFLTRLDQAAFFCRELDNHPMITLAADVYHLALEESDLSACLRTHHKAISVIYLVDSERRLPGGGSLPFPAIGNALRSMDYQGWLVLDGSAARGDRAAIAELSECLDFLRKSDLA